VPFLIPDGTQGPVRVTATLLYQTFNKEYMEFLRDRDVEPTEEFGGRARSLPAGGQYAHQMMTWGQTIFQIWEDTGQGPPVEMGQARFSISLNGGNGGGGGDEDDRGDDDDDDDDDDD